MLFIKGRIKFDVSVEAMNDTRTIALLSDRFPFFYRSFIYDGIQAFAAIERFIAYIFHALRNRNRNQFSAPEKESDMRLRQPSKALFSMLTTLSGMFTPVIIVLPLKDVLSSAVTGISQIRSGI